VGAGLGTAWQFVRIACRRGIVPEFARAARTAWSRYGLNAAPPGFAPSMGSSKPSRDAVQHRPAAPVWARLALVGLARVVALLAVFMGGVAATPAELNEAGRAAYSRGDFATAEALFSQAIAQSPRDPSLHYHRAIALTQLGRFEEAAREHQSVLGLGAPASLADLSRQALRDLAGFSGRRGPEVPIYPGRGGWLVEVMLNDSHSARFLVDTGAGFTAMSPTLLRTLGIALTPGSPAIVFRTLAGLSIAPMVTLRSIRIGDVLEENVSVAVHEIGPGIDGILGNNILSRYSVTIDPTRRVLELRPR
jgi:tetratricopeptide (TPR) repeat protein